LTQLVDSGVIGKKDSKYLLKSSWLINLDEYAFMTKERYSGRSPTLNQQTQYLTFQNMFEVDKFLISFAKKAKTKQSEILCLQWNHFWIPLFFPREEYANMKKILGMCQTYATTGSNTIIDQWCAAFWKEKGFHKKTGVKPISPGDVVVLRDTVIQVFYPSRLIAVIDKTYQKTKSISKLDANTLFDNVFIQKANIPCAIMRNPILAQQLRNEIIMATKHNNKFKRDHKA